MMITSCRFALAGLVALSVLSFNSLDSKAQEIVTFYPPQASVGYVPVQRGLLGRRISIEPVVSYSPGVVAASYVAPPVVTYGQPLPAAASSLYAPAVVTSYYAPAPVYSAPVYSAPVYSAYYAPAVYVQRPVYVAPAVYVAPVTTSYYYSPW